MTRRTGEFREFRIYMKKRIAISVQLLQLFAGTLRENEVARVTITRRDRLFAVGGLVIPIVTSKTPIPILVTNVVRMRTPVRLHLGKKILAIDGLRFLNEWIGLRGVRIGRAQ